MLDLCAEHKVTFGWIRGHTGHEELEALERRPMQGAEGGGVGWFLGKSIWPPGCADQCAPVELEV